MKKPHVWVVERRKDNYDPWLPYHACDGWSRSDARFQANVDRRHGMIYVRVRKYVREK